MRKGMKSGDDFTNLNEAEIREVEKMLEEEELKEKDEWEEIGRYLEIWRPTKIGATLEGEIVEIRDGIYGTEAIIQDQVGVRAQTPAHVILQRKIEQLETGDWVKISYLGRRMTASGRKVEDYQVLRRRRNEINIL